MTATLMGKLEKAEALFDAEGGSRNWNVRSEVRVPMFCGEVTTETVRTNHGTYARDEIFRPEYQLLGWLDVGYRFVKAYREDEGLIVIELKNGPLAATLEYRQFAS